MQEVSGVNKDHPEALPCLGVSKAGHDRGRLYIVLGVRDGMLQAADGVHSHVDKPKKKNEKHMQLVYNVSPEIRDLLKNAKIDSDLIHIKKLYSRIQSDR